MVDSACLRPRLIQPVIEPLRLLRRTATRGKKHRRTRSMCDPDKASVRTVAGFNEWPGLRHAQGVHAGMAHASPVQRPPNGAQEARSQMKRSMRWRAEGRSLGLRPSPACAPCALNSSFELGLESRKLCEGRNPVRRFSPPFRPLAPCGPLVAKDTMHPARARGFHDPGDHPSGTACAHARRDSRPADDPRACRTSRICRDDPAAVRHAGAAVRLPSAGPLQPGAAGRPPGFGPRFHDGGPRRCSPGRASPGAPSACWPGRLPRCGRRSPRCCGRSLRPHAPDFDADRLRRRGFRSRRFSDFGSRLRRNINRHFHLDRCGLGLAARLGRIGFECLRRGLGLTLAGRRFRRLEGLHGCDHRPLDRNGDGWPLPRLGAVAQSLQDFGEIRASAPTSEVMAPVTTKASPSAAPAGGFRPRSRQGDRRWPGDEIREALENINADGARPGHAIAAMR